MKRRLAAMALTACLLAFPAQAEAPNMPFVRRAEAAASAKSEQGTRAAAREEAQNTSKPENGSSFAKRAEAIASAHAGARTETQEEPRGESKKTPGISFTLRVEVVLSAQAGTQIETQEESRGESKKTPRTPFASRAEAVASAQVGTKALAREKTPAVSALEPGTQEAALCAYAERQAEALIAARSADEGMSDSLGAPDAETLQRLAAMEGEKPVYAALLLPSKGFGREEILDESGCGEEMLPTVAFELVYAANRGHADDAFAAWADRYSLYGVYAGDAPELAYVELIYGENLPQTVTVFVRAADGACLTRTSFVYNPSDYPEEIYMALPALADSFWYGLDTQVCALPEE